MTAEATKGFLLFYDYRQHLALLNDEEKGRLLMALLDYGEKGIEPEMDGALQMAFSFIRAQIDRDAARYEEKCRKRREAGKQGGRPPKANADEENQSKAKKANGFSENQEEAKEPYTNTNTKNKTNTKTNTKNKTNTKESPYGDSPIPTANTEQTTPYKANMAKVLEGKYDDQEKGGQVYDRDPASGGAALSGFRMAE